MALSVARPDLQIIAVSEDRSAQAVEIFFASHPELAGFREKIKVIFDEGGQLAHLYSTNEYPESFLINRNFVIDNKFTGSQRWTDSSMLSRIDRL